MTISARLFRVGSDRPETVDLDDRLVDGLDPRQLLWVDVTADPERQPELIRSIDEQLRLGGALADGASATGTSVRFGHETVSIHVLGLSDSDGHGVRPVALHITAAPNRVVSLHVEPVGRLSQPIEVVAADPRFGRLDAGTFMGLLLDGMLDGYFSEVERIERVIDDLDERALSDAGTDPLLDELVAIRARIALLRRSLAPQREVFASLLRPVEDQELSPVGWPWPGLPERLERALDATEQARQQLLGSFDIVMTRVGQRTNDLMRVLTVISAVLLPSVVVGGVMGMNFKAPLFDDPGNFPVVILAMALLALLILGVARFRHWI
ncbi:MAG: CorA family divalent cation transporter [Chloroflexi bacterium]|nr:CorA family divalent cation transporter [Chloroflexota bacterium]